MNARYVRSWPKRTSHYLFDQFVGAGEQLARHREAERLGGLEINRQFKLDRLLDRQVSGLRAHQDAIHIGGRASEQVGPLDSVGDKATAASELGHRINCRQTMLRSRGDDELAARIEKTVRQDNKPRCRLRCGRTDRAFNVALTADWSL